MHEVYTKYKALLCACYEDIASAYPAQYSVEQRRDMRYILARFSVEGLGFLTKALPSLAKDLDKALATDQPIVLSSFRKKRGTSLPSFLGWLFRLVFSADGRELEQSDPRALLHLRQLLYLFYKLETPYAEADTRRVIDDFVSVDSGLSTPWDHSEPHLLSDVRRASVVIHRILGGLCPRDIIPGHGPGSVATGERLDQKSYFKRDYRPLTSFYSLDSYFYMNANHVSECLGNDGLSVRDHKGRLHPWKAEEHGTAKVVLVPKDSRGPRLISMEPLEIQWIQQGQCRHLVKCIERHWLTRGHVNFENQEINRSLAWLSSHGGGEAPKTWPRMVKPLPRESVPTSSDLVTLDMKEASDRVSLVHLYLLFPSNWVEALMASRSSHTRLPDGRVLSLNKFAPMGSAVCFPVEALVFWALAMSVIQRLHPELKLHAVRRRVWVYGDDIVCHRDDYPEIQRTLEKTGLLLNSSKCCTGRFFRESCGMDAYKGVCVTPLRIKQLLPSGHCWSGQQLMAYVSYSNEAYRRGYTNLAISIEKLISATVPIPFTTVDRGAVQFVRPYCNVRALNKSRGIRVRFSKRLHFLEAYGPTPRAVIKGHRRVTSETYFTKYLSSTPHSTEGGFSLSKPKPPALEPDQYSEPHRVTSECGWTQISI